MRPIVYCPAEAHECYPHGPDGILMGYWDPDCARLWTVKELEVTIQDEDGLHVQHPQPIITNP